MPIAPIKYAEHYPVPASQVMDTWSLVTRTSEYWEFWEQIVSWLVKEVGPINQAWTYRWDENTYCFYFKYEEDKVKFILRWI